MIVNKIVGEDLPQKEYLGRILKDEGAMQSFRGRACQAARRASASCPGEFEKQQGHQFDWSRVIKGEQGSWKWDH